MPETGDPSFPGMQAQVTLNSFPTTTQAIKILSAFVAERSLEGSRNAVSFAFDLNYRCIDS